jgi:hypothetical protein
VGIEAEKDTPKGNFEILTEREGKTIFREFYLPSQNNQKCLAVRVMRIIQEFG